VDVPIENQPNFRGIRTEPPKSSSSPSQPSTNTSPSDDSPSSPSADSHHTLTNIPIFFSTTATTLTSRHHHTHAAAAAFQLLHYQWAVYGFGSGHFYHSCQSNGIPFRIQVAIDPHQQGRNFFKTFCQVPVILDSSITFLKAIRSNQIEKLQGYYLETPVIPEASMQLEFIKIQASIIDALSSFCHLQCFVIQLSSLYRQTILHQLEKTLIPQGWSFTRDVIHHPDLGDCIDQSTTFLLGIHTGITGLDHQIPLIRPPITSSTIEHFIYKPFDHEEFETSDLPDQELSDPHDRKFRISKSPDQHKSKSKSLTTHNLEYANTPTATLVGTRVCDRDYPAPPIDPFNFNPFNQLFGITFLTKSGRSHIRAISLYEYSRCWGMDPNLIVTFAKSMTNISLLSSTIPSKTSIFILKSIHDTLTKIRSENTSFLDTSAAPAATAITIPSFLSGATQSTLPTRATWIQAYQRDPETQQMLRLLQNPGLLIKAELDQIHYVYRQPIRSSMIEKLDNLLYIRETIDTSGNYVRLQIVPSELRNLIFIAFHANPIGAHFDTYHTFHRIRLRFHWPNMYRYIDHLCQHCVGCKLSKSRVRKSSSLIYSFPMDEPFKIIHADVYSVGVDQAFDGEKCYMNVLCGMTGYAISEPLSPGQINAAGFAKALMKILLANGLSHTIVIDKDSKFRGTFEETMQLLQINLHTASGGHHDPILTERFHVYLNRVLRLFCDERDSIRTSAEAIYLSCYAWNSAPVTGTDISRSLVVKGREFRFPIEYEANPAINLHPTTDSIERYSATQQRLLSRSREIFRILISEHRAMHREYIHSNRPDPLIYNVGDRVFARRATQSNRAKGRVGKIMLQHTGPWTIIEQLSGSSFKIRHCRTKTEDKKHASHLTPCPEELIPFAPLTGPDTSYSQIHKPINHHKYMMTGIDNHVESPPSVPNNFIKIEPQPEEQFPSVFDMNSELDDINTDTTVHVFESAVITELHPPITPCKPAVNLFGAPITPAKIIPAGATDLNSIITRVIQSADKLFFIAHRDPHTSYREWKLVQIDLLRTLNINPIALQNGNFLVRYLICHPDDRNFSAPNQRHWTEYHKSTGQYVVNTNFHLVRPSSHSATYCEQKQLVSYDQWLHINHTDIYIHGPFDFARINGRKTLDRISLADWNILHRHREKFDNQPPPLSQSSFTYSYHTNTDFHSIHRDTTVSRRMHAIAMFNHFNED
jgi:hypothetical protein